MPKSVAVGRSGAPRAARANGAAASSLAALLLALATTAAFLPAVRNGYTALDDRLYILHNHVVLGGLTTDGLRWAFTTFHAANWHPLTWLSHMLDVQVFGTDPRWHHLEGIVLHAASGAGFFLFLRGATGAAGRSVAAAALFALHPQRVESVAWAAERKDVLATFLAVLALLFWLSYTRRPTAGRYARTLAVFVLALLAKPSVMTLPLVFLVLDGWPFGRARGPAGLSWSRLLLEKAPFALAAGASLLVTWRAQSAAGMLPQALWPPRLANVSANHLDYLADFLRPDRLYMPHAVEEIAGQKVLAGLLVLIVLTTLAIRHRRGYPFLLAGWAWYLAAFLPTIGLVQFASQSIADRYTYLPAMGSAVMLAWWGAAAGPVVPAALRAGAAGLILLVLATLTWRQVGFWRDDVTLYRRAVVIAPGNALVRNNLGVALADAGRPEVAVDHYLEALRLNPRFVAARANLARAYVVTGRDEEAVAEMYRVLEMAPGEVGTRIDLGGALSRAGMWSEAMFQYQKALRLDPERPEALTGLGKVLASLGRREAAIARYRRALHLRPGYRPALQGLAALGPTD